ncbi:LacI family DNA-binding transcriptional regulator [Sporosarcina sp. NPDC096371]|uniref:LacI family DNA-binding transcriptional regulator n=1 Tax=Sporosarcina sp. NPDC096371 TaxID=3364530 RepID=UPI0038010BE3
MAATIKDIVAMTGLSLGTVSKYLNGYPVKEKNKALIEETIERLDFNVNLFARGLRTKESKSIGFIVPSLELTFSTKIVAVIERELAEHGYTVIICVVTGDSKADQAKLQNLAYQRVDGLLVIPPPNNLLLQQWLERMVKSIPIIVLDRLFKNSTLKHFVLVDNATAAFKATELLIEAGHHDIGIILGDTGGFTTDERLKGYLQALSHYNIPIKEEYQVYGKYRKAEGYKACEQLLSLTNRPTAIFVTNYDMTLGILECLNEHDVKVFDDISLIGFDLDEISKVINPNLTIVTQPVNEVGYYTAQAILKSLKDDAVEQEIKVFECSIQEGASIKEI